MKNIAHSQIHNSNTPWKTEKLSNANEGWKMLFLNMNYHKCPWMSMNKLFSKSWFFEEFFENCRHLTINRVKYWILSQLRWKHTSLYTSLKPHLNLTIYLTSFSVMKISSFYHRIVRSIVRYKWGILNIPHSLEPR